MTTMRWTVLFALSCALSCSEAETPRILDGERGACGSVVRGASPEDVECPADCPIAVRAYRVRNYDTCERSTAQYVACIGAGGSEGAGRPGAALLDTEDGPVFVDDPAIDCNRDEGCVGVSTTTFDRWQTCADAEDEGCDCMCRGGECPFDRFAAQLAECGLPSPCEPLTGDATPTEAQLQCHLDALADGGPIRFEADLPATDHRTGEETVARTVFAVSERVVTRVDAVAYERPSSSCDLQPASFFLSCDPEDPTDVNVENFEGLIQRLPCTDPRTWVANCSTADPVCPG